MRYPGANAQFGQGMLGQGAAGMVTVEAPNRRSDDRFRFSPAYTRVVVVPSTQPGSVAARPDALAEFGIDPADLDLGLGTPDGGFEGHGYDISLTGMRFELDEELPAGTEVTIDLFPPAERDPIRMRGTVVRVFARDDDPGPRRMAVQFTGFGSPRDLERLERRIDARACCWPA
jgi:hypothetical protein